MLRICLLFIAVTIVAGRRSPNHAYIEELIANRTTGYRTLNMLELALLDVPDLIRYNGYPAESHLVVTSDGYILEAHRIPHGRSGPSPNRPAVLLMHGLMSSSADYILMGPEKTLGYLLADQGYDVWLGNARGNYYSRRHVTLDPDSDLAFWKYSFDEIGNYDLPAYIDHILKVTQQSKLHYIGHSQGGTTFLVLTSMRPEYNKKIRSFQGLAPASYFTHSESEMLKTIAPYETIIETVAFSLGIREMMPRKCNEPSSSIGSKIEYAICTAVKPGAATKVSEEYQPLVAAHTPAGASIRQFRHFAQSISKDTFRRLDLDPISNLLRYGSFEPPQYTLSKISVPTYLHYGLADDLVNHNDVKKLASKIPNAVLNEMADPEFDHVDFLWHPNVIELLYKDMFKIMNKYN